MVVAAVIATCAFVLVIAAARSRYFLFLVVYVNYDSDLRSTFSSREEWAGVFYPVEWVQKGAYPGLQIGNDYDSMKTAGRVFLSLAMAAGLVSVGLMWYTLWRLWRMPVSLSAHGTASKELARSWSAATIAAALCAVTGALVFLIFGADECSPSAAIYPLPYTTVYAEGCQPGEGSYLLISSLLLWVFLVGIRKCVAPMYRSYNDVVREVDTSTCSKGDVDEDSPEIFSKGV
jgi:hypothetical protein